MEPYVEFIGILQKRWLWKLKVGLIEARFKGIHSGLRDHGRYCCWTGSAIFAA